MKTYKVSIKPYLNKRVQPITIVTIENGIPQELEAWPLYYQVVYKRKNTNIRSAFAKGLSEFTNHFTSLDPEKKTYENPQKVIERDVQIIEQIVRYEEANKEDFSIKGIRKAYDEYAMGLHHLINDILLSYLKLKLAMTLDQNAASLINFNTGSAYTIYKYTDILFKQLDIYTVSEHKAFSSMKIFFEIYNTSDPINTSIPNNLELHVEVPRDYFNSPLLIDFLNGGLETALISKGMEEVKTKTMIETVSMILSKPGIGKL